jgi:hypothetical protein
MSYPVLEFDWRENGFLADSIWNAQMAGHPKILTYSGPDLIVRRVARSGAMHFEHLDGRYEIPHRLSRDEYPFCVHFGSGKSSWVGHIPGRENSSQGGMIAADETLWSFKITNRAAGGVAALPPTGSIAALTSDGASHAQACRTAWWLEL